MPPSKVELYAAIRRDARAGMSGRAIDITVGGTDIGMIDVEYRPAEICLSRIGVHPSYRGRGRCENIGRLRPAGIET